MSFLFLYIIVFQENLSIVRYRRLINAWKTQNYRVFFEIFPRWLLTFPICFILAAYLAIVNVNLPGPISVFVFALLCFAARDIALLHFFKMSPGNQRTSQTTLFYLAILYVLLPVLFNVFHLDVGKSLFLPFPFNGSFDRVYAALLSAFFQALVATLLALGRWFKYGVKTA